MEKPVNNLKSPKHCTYSVSQSVLQQDVLVQGLDLLQDYADATLKAVLFKYGFDLDKGVSYRICEHRNVYGQVVTCALFMGQERGDERWRNLKKKLLQQKSLSALIS